MASLTSSSWIVDMAKCFGWIGDRDDLLTSFSQSRSSVFHFPFWVSSLQGICFQMQHLPPWQTKAGCGGWALAPHAVVGGGLCENVCQETHYFHFFCLFYRTGKDGHEWLKTKIIQLVFTHYHVYLFFLPQFASVATPTFSPLDWF